MKALIRIRTMSLHTPLRCHQIGGSREGFTLIEIMITIAVLTVLLMIAIPNMLVARSKARANVCRENLHSLAWAKEQWAMANNQGQGATVTKDDISPDYIRKYPVCPGGGSYTLNVIGETPTCSLGGDHTYP